MTILEGYKPRFRLVRQADGSFAREDITPAKKPQSRFGRTDVGDSTTKTVRASTVVPSVPNKPTQAAQKTNPATVHRAHAAENRQEPHSEPSGKPTNSHNVFGAISHGYSWAANQIPDRTYNVILAAIVSMGSVGVLLASLPGAAPNTANASNITVTPQTPSYRSDQMLPGLAYQKPQPAPVQIAIAPQAAPIQAAPVPRAAAPIAATPTAHDGIVQLQLRPGYVAPNLNKSYQTGAMRLIADNEGVDFDSYVCPAGKTTVGIGFNVEANLDMFKSVINCDDKTAQAVADGTIGVRFNAESVNALFSTKILETETNLRQRCKNHGVSFDSLPARAKVALMDISYIRPAWVSKELLASIKAGNYGIAAFQVAKISNAYVDHDSQRGIAERMAKNSLLLHCATPNHANRGPHDSIKFHMSARDQNHILSLAPAEANQAYIPQRSRSR